MQLLELCSRVNAVLNKMEPSRQQSRTWQCRNDTCPLPWCSVVVMWYLLGAGGTESGGGGHEVGGFDELRPVLLLSFGPTLKMDSDMQHDDASWLQQSYWLTGVDIHTPITFNIKWNNPIQPIQKCAEMCNADNFLHCLILSVYDEGWAMTRVQTATCWSNSRTEAGKYLWYLSSIPLHLNINNTNWEFKESGFETFNNMSTLVLPAHLFHTFTHLRVPAGRICLLLSIMGCCFCTSLEDLGDTGAAFWPFCSVSDRQGLWLSELRVKNVFTFLKKSMSVTYSAVIKCQLLIFNKPSSCFHAVVSSADVTGPVICSLFMFCVVCAAPLCCPMKNKKIVS